MKTQEIITIFICLDRGQVEELEKELVERRNKLEHYIKVLGNEIKARSTLISVLDQADAFYHNQRGEVKVVATAYRNYGNSIKTMKRKLEDLTKTLPSPIPSPDINAPSPGPADDDFVLPGEKNFSQVSSFAVKPSFFKHFLMNWHFSTNKGFIQYTN